MLFEIALAILFPPLLYVLYTYVVHILQLRSYPPGPFPLPLIGNLHQLSKKPYETFRDLATQYGDVFSISFGMQRFVVVNTIESAREALISKGNQFAGRPSNVYTAELVSRGYINIGFADYGPLWTTLRKIGHSSIKMYGEGLGRIEKLAVQESEDLHSRLRKTDGQPVELHYELGLSILNIICGIVFGHRYGIEDKEFKDIIKFSNLIFSGLGNSDAVAFLPWLRFFPLEGLKKLREGIKIRDPLLRKQLLEHKETFDPENIRDLTDTILKVSKEEKVLNKAGLESFTDDHLEMMINDVFVGGYETTLTTLRWSIVYLLHWPMYQDQIYEEILKVVGPDRYPNPNDRASMHLVQASIHEILRLSSLAPLMVPHKATQNSSINGQPIPKDGQVLFNVWSYHNDERYWKNPKEFNPHRWLDDEGKCVPNNKVSYLPFGAGRRACLGESVAKIELFIFYSRLLRDFRVEKAPNEPLPSIDGELGITLSPAPFSVVFTPRNNNLAG